MATDRPTQWGQSPSTQWGQSPWPERGQSPWRKRGQALVELAIGMFVVSLVVAALLAFTTYIIRSLNEQRTLRAEAGRSALGGTGGDGAYASASCHVAIDVSPMASEHIFGSRQVEVSEEVHMPVAGLQRF